MWRVFCSGLLPVVDSVSQLLHVLCHALVVVVHDDIFAAPVVTRSILRVKPGLLPEYLAKVS